MTGVTPKKENDPVETENFENSEDFLSALNNHDNTGCGFETEEDLPLPVEDFDNEESDL